nr:PHB depolymerase family esterase [Patulibacter sp. SYSU D01012]
MYVPAEREEPSPLVVLLHGAGGAAEAGIELLREHADEHGLLLLAPDARRATWDRVRGTFGPDVAFVQRALQQLLARHPVDPRRVALGGFSDGASYALSLGLGNGDLFTHLIALSPGFAAPPVRVGRPRIFVSHGVEDEVLPIDRCSRRLVPMLREEGYDVRYEEFADGHAVPPWLAAEAVRWFAAADGPDGTAPAGAGGAGGHGASGGPPRPGKQG